MLKHLLNASSLMYLLILIFAITEVGISYALKSDTKEKLDNSGTKVYFRISEVILPGLPATHVLIIICYAFSAFLHGMKRKKYPNSHKENIDFLYRLFFALNPANRKMAQQPATEKDVGGFLFFMVFRSFLITFFHFLAIFFSRKARTEYIQIEEQNSIDNGDFISRANAVFALNIISLIFYYGLVVLDVFVQKEEVKLYKKLMYERLN